MASMWIILPAHRVYVEPFGGALGARYASRALRRNLPQIWDEVVNLRVLRIIIDHLRPDAVRIKSSLHPTKIQRVRARPPNEKAFQGKIFGLTVPAHVGSARIATDPGTTPARVG